MVLVLVLRSLQVLSVLVLEASVTSLKVLLVLQMLVLSLQVLLVLVLQIMVLQGNQYASFVTKSWTQLLQSRFTHHHVLTQHMSSASLPMHAQNAFHCIWHAP